MQHRLRMPLIIFAILLTVFASVWGASYIYTPKPVVATQTITLDVGQLMANHVSPAMASEQVEYP